MVLADNDGEPHLVSLSPMACLPAFEPEVSCLKGDPLLSGFVQNI